jgi:MSHA biogenesis protein MshE
MKLGEILIAQGLVTRAAVDEALERQKTEGRRLGSILVAMGVLTVSQLLATLRYQRQIDSALDLCERTLRNWESTHGAAHPSTNRARYNLARALVVAGRAGDALPYAEAAYAGHLDGLGRHHAWTLESCTLLTELRRAVPEIAANYASAR